jgi:MYXO-CTERM domain-containing protein
VTGVELGAQLVIVREGDRVAMLDATGADRMFEVPLVASANEDAIRAELWLGVLPLAVTSHVYLRPLTEGGGDAGPSDAGTIADAGAPEPTSGCGCRVMGHSSRPVTLAWLVGLASFAATIRRRAR